jgi:hypothetical protein
MIRIKSTENIVEIKGEIAMFDEIKEVNYTGYKEVGRTKFLSYHDEKFKIETVQHISGCPAYYTVSLDYWLYGQGWLNIISYATYHSKDIDIDKLMEIAYMFIPGYTKPIKGKED